MHTLYLCYFGLREPLVQTQVLPYLREIAKGGVTVSLLTFEPNLRERWDEKQIAAMREELAEVKIDWHCLEYHKTPTVPATLFDVMNGARYALKLVRQKKIQVLHARTHIPLMMALIVKRLTGCRIIFDIRGLVAEEYVDSGNWQNDSLPFRMLKKVERAGLRRAEQIVVLTQKMKDYLIEKNFKAARDIEVIPCCMDFSRIEANDERAANGGTAKNSRFELIYAGSVTGLYLLEEMGRFFLELKKRRPDAFFRVLTVSPPAAVAATFERIGIRAEDFAVGAAKPAEVPAFVKRASLAISFRKPTFSQIAASPTKIPEYLAVGVPVVTNAGIGDMDALIESANVGVIVSDFDDQSLFAAADNALNLLADQTISARCVAAAIQNFDLTTVGGANYLNVYKRIEADL